MVAVNKQHVVETRFEPGNLIALVARVIPRIIEVPGDNEAIIRIEGLAYRRIPVTELLYVKFPKIYSSSLDRTRALTFATSAWYICATVS